MNEIDGDCFSQADMAFSGIEMHVAEDTLFFSDKHRHQDIFSSTSLVCGYDKLIADDILQSCLQVKEICASGIGFITDHHSGPLVGAHSRGAAVGQQVYIDIFGF